VFDHGRESESENETRALSLQVDDLPQTGGCSSIATGERRLGR
jgi:hypothetical protein